MMTAGVICAAIAVYLVSSQRVPITGRRQFNFLSDDFIALVQGSAIRAKMLKITEGGGRFLPAGDPRAALVRRVMQRLIPASGMARPQWEVYVYEGHGSPNAFLLPGGKVFVHSGLLGICRSEDALAAVLGHELAHGAASHMGERDSANWVANLTVISVFFLGGVLPGLAFFTLWSLAGGPVFQDIVYRLPLSRTQETEADCIGLMMMAEACYDPREAIWFWGKMDALQKAGGAEVSDILSTHPSSASRMAKMEEWLPRAMQRRQESDCRATRAFADRFREALRTDSFVFTREV